MSITADSPSRLRARTSEKWVAYPEDVLPLFVAETDYPLAPAVADAVIARVRASDSGYVSDCSPAARAFAGFARERWGWEADPDRIRTTTDVGVAIVEILRLLLPRDSEVVVMPPIYPPFFGFVAEAGHRSVSVPLRADRGHAIDLEGIRAALAAGARAILLCHPHNPLGRVHPKEELAALAALPREHGAIVVSDEIHAPLVRGDQEFVPFLAVSDDAAEVGVCATAASKGWNIAGFKCALYASASEGMAARLEAMNEEVLWRTSILGLHATAAAYADGGEWLDDVLGTIAESRELLASLVAARLPGVGFAPPAAGYLGWLDFRALGWDEDPAARILREARVALVPGPEFGPEGEGFARINFACSPEMLTEAIDRIARLALRDQPGQPEA